MERSLWSSTKTPVEDLAVFVAIDAVTLLSQDALMRAMELGASVFFNLDDFIS